MGSEFDASWAKVGPRITLLTASGQLGAAKNGAASVPAILAELGQSVDPLGEVNLAAFAGIASDGRALDSLLYGAVTTAKTAASTMPTAQALQAGGQWLDGAVHTQIADASRGAAGVAIAVRPGVGYVRQASGSSCPRCAVLVGKWFRFNQGFNRHPRDDCFHIPSTQAGAGDLLSTPEPSQITGLSKADRKALDEGADMNQVINAKRGASGMTTSEGTTRQGLAGQRLAKGQQRLTPEGIYRSAANREEAIALLRENGYITGSARVVAAPVQATRTLTLTGKQSAALDPSAEVAYSAAARLRNAPVIASTEQGKVLAEAAERWQLDKTQVRAIREVADRRLAGAALDDLPLNMAGLDRETLARYADALLDGARDYAGTVPDVLYRGLSVPAKLNDLAATYAEGETVDIGLSSWTSANDIAQGFIDAGRRGEVELMLRVEGGATALPLQNLTTSAAKGLWEEREWLTAGRYKVVKTVRTRGRLEVTLRQLVGP